MGDPSGDGRGPISWGLILAGVLVWAVVVYLGYVVVDMTLSWLATSGGAVLDAGKNAGSTLGVGKEVGTVIDTLKSTGVVDQGVSLLRIILKPAAIVFWMLGALAIVLLPRMLSMRGGASRRDRH